MCRGHSHIAVRLVSHVHNDEWCRVEMVAITQIALELEDGPRLVLPRSSNFVLWLRATGPAYSCVIARTVEPATSEPSIKILFSEFGSMQPQKRTHGLKSKSVTIAVGAASSSGEDAPGQVDDGPVILDEVV